MKVTPVTAPDVASDPKHPDHDRWLKDYTLKMEIDHAKAVGLSTRDAEAENIRMLERSEQMARQAALTPKKKNAGHQERKARRGVTTRSVEPKKPQPKKGCSCGYCNPCRRAQRISLIMQMGRQNSTLGDLAKKLMVVSLQASAGTGQFLGLNANDKRRALHAYVDAACDASISVLGRWR